MYELLALHDGSSLRRLTTCCSNTPWLTNIRIWAMSCNVQQVYKRIFGSVSHTCCGTVALTKLACHSYFLTASDRLLGINFFPGARNISQRQRMEETRHKFNVWLSHINSNGYFAVYLNFFSFFFCFSTLNKSITLRNWFSLQFFPSRHDHLYNTVEACSSVWRRHRTIWRGEMYWLQQGLNLWPCSSTQASIHSIQSQKMIFLVGLPI